MSGSVGVGGAPMHAQPLHGLAGRGWARPAGLSPARLYILCGSWVLAASLAGSGSYGTLGAMVVVALGLAYACAARRLPLWQGIVLLTVCCYILLNRGFGYVGVMLGTAPLLMGELTTAAALTLLPHRRVLAKIRREGVFVLMILWMAYGTLIVMASAPSLSVNILKDASLILYAIYFYFGYAVFITARSYRSVLGMLYLTFFLHFAYLFGFPQDVLIQNESPKVLYELGLFGHYNQGDVHLVGGALFFVLVARFLAPRASRRLVLVGACYFGTLMFVQSRAGLLTSAVCLALLIAFGYRRQLSKLMLGLVGAVFLVVALSSVGIVLEGWKGPVTLDFLGHMVETIFGGGGGQYEEAGLLGSRESRLSMWMTAAAPSFQSPTALVFGRGFHELLIDIELTTGWIKRSPHNSFVTIFARLGLIGLILFVVFHVLFVRYVARALRFVSEQRLGFPKALLTWMGLYYVSFNIGAFFGVVYDTPYMAAPAYFIMGCAYGLSTVVLSGRSREPTPEEAVALAAMEESKE